MSIATEIEGLIAHLLDPQTTWVHGSPKAPGQACALYRYVEPRWPRPSNMFASRRLLCSPRTEAWLHDFVASTSIADVPEEDNVWAGITGALYESVYDMNDDPDVTRTDMWLMLEEARDEAIEEGV